MAQNPAQQKEALTFELVSPEAILANDTVEMVIIPGTEGYFAVMAGHAPFLSSLRAGVIEVRKTANDTAPRRIFVSGGVSDVNGAVCTVLATDAIAVEDLDLKTLEQRMRDVQEDLSREKTTEQMAKHLNDELILLKAKIEAVTGKIVL